MMRTQWKVLMISRPLDVPNHWAEVTHVKAEGPGKLPAIWHWCVRDHRRLLAEGEVATRHYAIVKATREAAKLGLTKHGAGLGS
jgi:hypothetical protein